MLVIWGRGNSVNVQKVLCFCEEAGLAYERIDAGGAFGVVNGAHYRALNPNGLVPTIDDDGFVLWESNAILRYLAAKHAAGGLWPADPRARARADQWMTWHDTTFWPAIRPLFFGLVRLPPEQRDKAAEEASRQQAADALARLDAHLATSEYAAGGAFSVADIALGAGVWRWMALPIERPALRHLQRWFDALAQRPAYRKAVMQPLT